MYKIVYLSIVYHIAISYINNTADQWFFVLDTSATTNQKRAASKKGLALKINRNRTLCLANGRGLGNTAQLRLK